MVSWLVIGGVHGNKDGFFVPPLDAQSGSTTAFSAPFSTNTSFPTRAFTAHR